MNVSSDKHTLEFIGDRGDVELDRLGSLGRRELRATENAVVVVVDFDADATKSGGLEGLRQGEAEDRGGGGGIGEVEDLSSGEGHVGLRQREVGGSEVAPVEHRQDSVGHFQITEKRERERGEEKV